MRWLRTRRIQREARANLHAYLEHLERERKTGNVVVIDLNQPVNGRRR